MGRGGAVRILRLVGALFAVAACVWGVLRLKPWARSGEPVAERTRKANKLLLLASGLGGVLGAVLAIGAFRTGDPFAFLSNGPMPLAVVIPAIGIWLIAMLLSLQWHRSIDEHEARAYEFGGLAGLYLYSFLAPAWWLAWRGGLAPAPDTMAIFLAVMTVWSVVWFWRRFR